MFALENKVWPFQWLNHENYGPRIRQTGPSGIAIGRGISHGEGYEGGHDPVPMPMASLAIFSSRLCFAWSILQLTCPVHFHIVRKCFTPSQRWSETEDRIHAQSFLSLVTFRLKLNVDNVDFSASFALCSSSFSWTLNPFRMFHGIVFIAMIWILCFGKVRWI